MSMTGFGSGLSQKGGVSVAVEIRTVNHRFLDLHIRLSREYSLLETEIQQAIRSALSRGRVDVSVTIQSTAPAELLINKDLAKGYMEAARTLRQELQLTDTLELRTLLILPGVVQNKDSLDIVQGGESNLREALLESLQAALEGVVRMRRQEGEALRSDMGRHLTSIAEKSAQARASVPSTVEEYRSRLQERLEQLLPPKVVVDPQRIAQEVAILAERSDISEEFARLDSHISQFTGLLESGKEAGKKMDFLLQEMQREVNTMLSKSGNLDITRLGIAFKADIEKLREQVQNVE
jgi:uncharacterized protein (TIGR00255 family)